MPTVVRKRRMSDQQDTANATLNLNAHSHCSQRSTLSSVSQSTRMDAATAVGTEVTNYQSRWWEGNYCWLLCLTSTQSNHCWPCQQSVGSGNLYRWRTRENAGCMESREVWLPRLGESGNKATDGEYCKDTLSKSWRAQMFQGLYRRNTRAWSK